MVDDLADVLSRMVVGWEPMLGADLAQHPDVIRVMARYRQEREKSMAEVVQQQRRETAEQKLIAEYREQGWG